MLLRLRGNPSHFHRNLLILLSKPLCCLCGQLNAPPFTGSSDAQHIVDPAERLGCKPSTSHLYSLTLCVSTVPSTLLHLLCVLGYLPLIGSFIQSFQKTVSSKRMICLEASELSTIYGLSNVMAMVSGNFRCLPKSTFSSQSCVDVSKSEEKAVAAVVAFSPALTKAMLFFDGCRCLQWVIPLKMVSATA